MNRTNEGLECQPWSSQEPHSHDRPPNVFPQIVDGENYCRNVGGNEPMPWCFTTDPKIRWQYCNIPKCGKSLNKFLFISKLNNFLYKFFKISQIIQRRKL